MERARRLLAWVLWAAERWGGALGGSPRKRAAVSVQMLELLQRALEAEFREDRGLVRPHEVCRVLTLREYPLVLRVLGALLLGTKMVQRAEPPVGGRVVEAALEALAVPRGGERERERFAWFEQGIVLAERQLLAHADIWRMSSELLDTALGGVQREGEGLSSRRRRVAKQDCVLAGAVLWQRARRGGGGPVPLRTLIRWSAATLSPVADGEEEERAAELLGAQWLPMDEPSEDEEEEEEEEEEEAARYEWGSVLGADARRVCRLARRSVIHAQ